MKVIHREITKVKEYWSEMREPRDNPWERVP